MSEIKVNYDEDADMLYVSFGRSEHVTGIALLAGLEIGDLYEISNLQSLQSK